VAGVFADAAAVLLFTKSGFPPLALAVGYAIIFIAIYLAAVRWIERRAATEFSMRRALPELGGGFLGGAGLISGAIAILWLAGVYRPADGQLKDVEGSGGVSPINAPASTRAAEATFANGWFSTITQEVFG
jgi:hypothetical protein